MSSVHLIQTSSWLKDAKCSIFQITISVRVVRISVDEQIFSSLLDPQLWIVISIIHNSLNELFRFMLLLFLPFLYSAFLEEETIQWLDNLVLMFKSLTDLINQIQRTLRNFLLLKTGVNTSLLVCIKQCL